VLSDKEFVEILDDFGLEEINKNEGKTYHSGMDLKKHNPDRFFKEKLEYIECFERTIL
jgi:hypothetical protein